MGGVMSMARHVVDGADLSPAGLTARAVKQRLASVSTLQCAAKTQLRLDPVTRENEQRGASSPEIELGGHLPSDP